MELIQTDLPEPVAPAMSIWGILEISATHTLPPMSLPKHMVTLLFASRNAWESIISRMGTTLVCRLGTSMPTAALLGIGASMRTPLVARFKAISSARLVILLILTPAEGCSSYRVTAGPLAISMMRVCTPKLASASTSS